MKKLEVLDSIFIYLLAIEALVDVCTGNGNFLDYLILFIGAVMLLKDIGKLVGEWKKVDEGHYRKDRPVSSEQGTLETAKCETGGDIDK